MIFNEFYIIFIDFKQFTINFIEFLADSAVKNHDFQKTHWKIMKISETCMKFREETISDYPGVPK